MASTPTTAVVVLTGGDLAELPKLLGKILKNQEKLMADFAALRSALEDQKQEMLGAIDRVAADVQALQAKIADLELDTADQAAVDALTTQVQESVEVLRGIDPVAAIPAEEPPAETPPAEAPPAEEVPPGE